MGLKKTHWRLHETKAEADKKRYEKEKAEYAKRNSA